MNHCNDFAPWTIQILLDNTNSYSYSYIIYMCVKIVSPQCYSIWPYVCENCFATMNKIRIRIRIFLLPQGANNLIQWLKWLETYKDTCKHTQQPGKHSYVQWLHGQIRAYQIPP